MIENSHPLFRKREGRAIRQLHEYPSHLFPLFFLLPSPSLPLPLSVCIDNLFMTPDDHPWPEIGSVSRGATRGNQGSKGSLSPPGPDGRCILQLRVQPGVLAVTLTRQASEHYRILDDAVTSALKLTKGFWRKARRRQDYDAQADQDHIELNEWLQVCSPDPFTHFNVTFLTHPSPTISHSFIAHLF